MKILNLATAAVLALNPILSAQKAHADDSARSAKIHATRLEVQVTLKEIQNLRHQIASVKTKGKVAFYVVISAATFAALSNFVCDIGMWQGVRYGWSLTPGQYVLYGGAGTIVGGGIAIGAGYYLHARGQELIQLAERLKLAEQLLTADQRALDALEEKN